MGKAIVVGLVVIAVVAIIAGVTVYFRRRQGKETALAQGWAIKGDLTARQERVIITQLAEADYLFRQLLTPPTTLEGEMTLLTWDHRTKIESWLRQTSALSTQDTRRAIDHS